MLSFLVFAVMVFAAAAVGGRFAPGEWYAALSKPSWTPPAWVFGPVWTLLYLAIAAAGWLVWRGDGQRAHVALAVWAVQLVLNAAWSWLFFGLHRPDLALVDIVLLLVAIAAFCLVALEVEALAAGLFIPYLLWAGFATALNLAIRRLNLREAA